MNALVDTELRRVTGILIVQVAEDRWVAAAEDQDGEMVGCERARTALSALEKLKTNLRVNQLLDWPLDRLN